ncbi:MAG: hypothetical protein AAB393_03260 [Bacteroidota bacterium]
METENKKLQERLERLFSRHRFGIKPGLEVERALMEGLGNPERAYGVIHVTGTNGKGSVCAMLGSILRMAGFKVPRYVEFLDKLPLNATGKVVKADLHKRDR